MFPFLQRAAGWVFLAFGVFLTVIAADALFFAYSEVGTVAVAVWMVLFCGLSSYSLISDSNFAFGACFAYVASSIIFGIS